ncbi:hypothetical protein [Sphingobium agri]|uniref:Transposase n=1 Tax=Sphingobium agri TaxID=2933566 RepID=A0ABT0DUW1_9SPHN|nr:hypothetical protein [Sphingobium agri]MCK0530834.1 hypothetical protein [Sphingobium agri]
MQAAKTHELRASWAARAETRKWKKPQQEMDIAAVEVKNGLDFQGRLFIMGMFSDQC